MLPYGLPAAAPSVASLLTQGSAAPDTAFTWGSRGRRMTPEDVARERAIAARQMRADYSPVASPWQGLARVADQWLGSVRDRDARKASERNAAEGADIARLLMDSPEISAPRAAAAGGPIVPVDIPPSTAAPDMMSVTELPGDAPPPISEAPPPPADWRQTVNADPVAASLISQTEAQQRVARALAARPSASPVAAPVYRPRDAIVQALTNPYVDQNIRSFAEKLWAQEYEQSKPQFFMSGEDRVSYNPVSGESQMVYDAPEDFQLYADQMGYEPGTDDYNDAMSDYVLRASGPTAQLGREYLEGLRQENRLAVEGERQKNRMQLRQTPTWQQANPRQGGGRSGARAGGPTTMAGVIAPILAKVAQGQPLSAGEQQALNTYYRRNGGRGGSPSGGVSGGQVIRNPKTGERMEARNGKWVPVK